ncbi:MAG: SAM-dependent methyltransferase [Steroidobacteraceae bacterium]|jgi:SAM-dependent MidA family methyltransferase|nr:SAM-dependent methyltransferase [Steroidobacteraceae bacterium]
MTRGHRTSIGTAPLALPAPEGAALAHLARVEALLRERIAAAGGWLDFAQYMSLALYAPGLGYYSAGAAKFGPAGDFVTAPEISDLFAQVLADALPPLFAAAGARRVLELGPGTGRFAGTVLRELEAAGAAPEEYLLLEVGADLRARQPARVRELAGATAARARWLDTLPPRFDGVVFGNEVLDALPCERFVMRGGEPWRLGVVPTAADAIPGAAPAAGAAAFAWHARRVDGSRAGDDAFVATLARCLPPVLREALPEGYVGEFQPSIGSWIGALGATLGRGALLLADYGLPRAHYYHPQRGAGSLRAHYRHRAHDDPFLYPGLTDLSTWVDFTAVAEAAQAAGLEVAGFATQAAVLLGGGVEARLAAAMQGADERARARLAHGARQLLLPGEMGESVKLMLLTRGVGADAVPAGFRLRDLRDSL